MDKAWVWLPRNCVEYEEGATKFVFDSSKRLGNVSHMWCPCLDCRNVVHQSTQTVFDHLVIRGMDEKYKKNNCWSKHGDIWDANRTDVYTSENEAYDLIRTAFIETEGKQPSQNQNADEFDDIDNQVEDEFRKKLEDAETPLYQNCLSYTKVSAIMGLYRIKVKSGMSENFFDQLLTLVHDMLPEDNVLPKSTDEMKRFLKMFGFGYDSIHACKNDCILYRNEYEDLVTCPRCSESRWEKDKHTGDEVIAQGILISTDPSQLVNGMPLGLKAATVKITLVVKPDAYLWRPTTEIPFMADALNETIAWPFDRLKQQVQPEDANRKSPMEEATTKSVEKSGSPSTGSSGKGGKPKCALMDIGNSGQRVAIGRVYSNDPADTVHCRPLGPNASKVLVEIPKVNDARVWRTSPEFETIADAVGTFVAWPNEKIIML